jgi:hypothetical protein
LREGAAEDAGFIPLILWKLGFGSFLEDDPHARFWQLHEEMEKMVRSVPGSALGPTLDEFRGTTANYFVELEGILDDSLCFTTWALTNDHITSKKPFTYQVDAATSEAHVWLNTAAMREPENTLEYGERITLYGLCRGFQVLASELLRMVGNRSSFLRTTEDIPDWAHQQALQKFPFSHIVPYLDLTDEARSRIVSSLQEISRTLVTDEVYNARNEWLHGRRNIGPVEKMRASLQAVRAAVQLIEDCGFARIPYAVSHRSSDGFGRDTATFTSTRGFQFSIHKPSQYDWLNLPGIGTAIHVMSAAAFAAPSHVLRFTSETSSPYTEMWDDYPRRKPRSQRAIRAVEKLDIHDD